MKRLTTFRRHRDSAPAAQALSLLENGRRLKVVRLYLTAIILLILMFALYLWQSTKIVEVKLRLEHLSKSIESIDTNNGVLKAEIAKLQSLTRIEQVAKTELGMVVPRKLCYIPMPDMPKPRTTTD